MEMQQISKNIYKLPRKGLQKVDILLYMKKELLTYLEDDAIKQLTDAASLKGLAENILAMPDLHTGFGLPIGGIMAMEENNGLISAGAVGMDINCGVRLLRLNIQKDELNKSHIEKIIKSIKQKIPAGVGKKSKHKSYLQQHFKSILEKGLPFMIDLGFGEKEDKLFVEENGSLPGASIKNLSKKAFARRDQLSTLGGGNHFIELGCVDTIFNDDLAKSFCLNKNNLTILIHTGSRGLGHQICTDYSSTMNKKAASYGVKLPSKGLAAVPISSPEGKSYYSAMCCAANFAYCNRQIITHDIREAFADALGKPYENYGLNVIYDISHNIASFEEIKGSNLLIHRKGAVRALPPGHKHNPPQYIKTGHPIIIPGNMGDASYVVAATEKVKDTLFSANHGAGRVLSRKAAKQAITADMFLKSMEGVYFSEKPRHFLDEAPQAYKNIDLVVDTLAEEGIIKKVAKLKPLAVIKGKDVG